MHLPHSSLQTPVTVPYLMHRALEGAVGVDSSKHISGGFAAPVPKQVVIGHATTPLFTVTVTQDSDRATVTLRGELDLMSVALLIECLARLTPAVGAVILDFAELDFIDCSGLHAIADAAHTLAAQGDSLSIHSPLPHARRVLGLVKFGQVVAISP